MNETKAIRGDIAFSVTPEEIEIYPQSYIILEGGIVSGIFRDLPAQYAGIEITDFGHKLIIPGFVDLHVHASQVYERGLGLDMELLDWLDRYTFPQEARFIDPDYAQTAYGYFADQLVKQGTICASVYATTHLPATEILFDLLDRRGLFAFVGKVNMDQNCPDGLCESCDDSLRLTEEFILKSRDNKRIKPILTPRFVPVCSAELLAGLGKLAQRYNLPVQSHISENLQEVAWVKRLHPDCVDYGTVYNKYGLFGQTPTLMAHAIYLTEAEIALAAHNKVIAVHCPDSNLNLASGVMPLRKMLRQGVRIGLGSDVGGGHNLSMAKTIVRAIQLSKVAKILDPDKDALTFEEAYYLGTKGGGDFFGATGSFEKGYRFDAIVIDDANLGDPLISLSERLQRFVYIGDDRNIVARFAQGRLIG